MRKITVLIPVIYILLFVLTSCQPVQSAENDINTPTIQRTPHLSSTNTPALAPPTPTITATRLPTISIPEITGLPPNLDGDIDPGEWDQATSEFFADGSELLLMQTGDILYIAIRASTQQMIVGNIYLQRGDQISIMHASAALGTAIYAREDQSWMQTQNFNWRCRAVGFNEEAISERDAFLQEEGWLANNSRMGNFNELEYQIKIGNGITALAVVFLQNQNPHPYPAGLDDDSVQLFSGGIPEEMRFSTELWAPITLSSN
jgi:hypothetical protein